MPRPQKRYHYIYKTTCQITGKFYVGMHSTDDLDDGYLGSGKVLRYSITKHGRENHKKEIIEMCPSREALKLREREIVNEQLLADPLNINLKYGGEGGGKFKNVEHQRKCTEAAANFWKTNKPSAEHIAKGVCTRKERGIKAFVNSTRFSGKKHAVETIMKMRARQKLVDRTGQNNPMFGKRFAWINKNSETKRIPLEQLDAYLVDGWIRGLK